MSMKLETRPGDRVKYTTRTNLQVEYGGASDPAKFFDMGAELAVSAIQVGGFSSVVQFAECPDTWFNTVHFKNL